jgi:PLP dependent protein
MSEFDDRVRSAVAEVQSRIDAAAGGRAVTLVAVTKGFGPEAPAAAMRAGLQVCGENYAQELVEKAQALQAMADAGAVPAVPQWHVIGRLQRNKVRLLAPHVSVWQSVDRLDLGTEIARRQPGATVYVQCNISGEDTKAGVALNDAPALVDDLGNLGLEVQGLMGIGPAGAPEAARPGFAALVALAERLGLPERSLGMSADLEVALQEGATVVRVGSDLFGPRV